MNRNSIVFLALIILILSSCQKDVEVENSDVLKNEDFISLEDRNYLNGLTEQIFSEGNGPENQILTRSEEWRIEVQIANQIIYDLDSEVPFMEELSEQYGLPCWECGVSIPGYFNVSIPFYQNNVNTGLMNFVATDADEISFNFNLKEFNENVQDYSDNFTLEYNDLIYDLLDNTIEGIDEPESQTRDLCPPGSSMVSINLSGSSGTSLCVCMDENNHIVRMLSPDDCEGGSGDLDGGQNEAGGLTPDQFATWAAWMSYYNNFLSDYTGGASSSSSARPGNNKEDLIRDIQATTNEQTMLSWLTTFLEDEYGSPLPSDIQLILLGDPQVTKAIYLYMQGHYGVTGQASNVYTLIELLLAVMPNNPPLIFKDKEVKHLLTFEPGLMNSILNLIDNHPHRAKAVQAIHDFIGLQHCNSIPCTHSNYPNHLEAIYQLYISLSSEHYNWLHNMNNAVILETGGGLSTLESFLKFYLENLGIGQSTLISVMPDLIDFAEEAQMTIGTLVSIENIESCLESNDFAGCAAETILENRFDVDIVTTFLIDGVFMGLDSDGILHVDIESISMENSTEVEILNQLLNVLKETRKLFCETDLYEPIDLRDYYHDRRNQFWQTTWNGHENVALDMTFVLQRYIIDTSPDNKDLGQGRRSYNWNWHGTTIPGIAITCPISASADIEAFLYTDCD